MQIRRSFSFSTHLVFITIFRSGLAPQCQLGAEVAFASFEQDNWHPLTWLSHALDCQLFGLNPAGPHYETLILHAGNAILLFLLLENATTLVWPSFMVAALFALHPVNVESVP
jgi:protein O-mannosyl-transferase